MSREADLLCLLLAPSWSLFWAPLTAGRPTPHHGEQPIRGRLSILTPPPLSCHQGYENRQLAHPAAASVRYYKTLNAREASLLRWWMSGKHCYPTERQFLVQIHSNLFYVEFPVQKHVCLGLLWTLNCL